MLPLGNGLGQQGQQRQQQRDGATRLAVAEAAGSPVCQLAEDVKDTQALGRDTPTVPQVPVDEIIRAFVFLYIAGHSRTQGAVQKYISARIRGHQEPCHRESIRCLTLAGTLAAIDTLAAAGTAPAAGSGSAAVLHFEEVRSLCLFCLFVRICFCSHVSGFLPQPLQR